MNLNNIKFELKHHPELDSGFIPIHKFNETFLKTATIPLSIALEGPNGEMSVKNTFIHGIDEFADADWYYIERLVKTMLWQKGGFRVFVKGSEKIFSLLKDAYRPDGLRAFDAKFMGGLYQTTFEVVLCDALPKQSETSKSLGRNFEGCRIGFDAGGSDYKVAAVIDGEAVYTKETVWNPKINSDPEYHFTNIVAGLKDAMSHLPRVDAVGISSAGVVANNKLLYAHLFNKVPREKFDAKGRDIYSRAVKELGDTLPFELVNDGDAAALAGSIGLNRNNLLGVAMGTSFAGGFVNSDGNIMNWLNEVAFIPIDVSPTAAFESWTGDYGVPEQYFCQNAVVRLADAAGISLETYETPAQKLKAVQNMLDDGHEGAAAIFRTIGCYLGHSAPYYHDIYGATSILVLGRVMSGKGGSIILETALNILADEYPNIQLELVLPDEKTRRLGQSVIAASLPKV